MHSAQKVAFKCEEETLAELVPQPTPNSFATEVQTQTDHANLPGSDLDKTICLLRKTLDHADTSQIERGFLISILASAVFERYEQRDQRSDLDEAISLHREALILQPVTHAYRARSLINLATALRTQLEIGDTDQLENLDEVIFLLREAVDLCPQSHADRAPSLFNLADALHARFEQTRHLPNLDETISLHREVLILWSEPHPHYTTSLNNIAGALHIRFQQTHQLRDLDEALSLFREALGLRPSPHQQRSSSLGNLAMALHTRFEQIGNLTDLDEVVLLYREAVFLQPTPHPRRSSSLNNLATALQTRFGHTGKISDLDETILLHREVLLLRSAPHASRFFPLNNLAAALQTRFRKTGQLPDLDQSILLHREALVLRPEPHPGHASSSSNLAVSLHTRFRHTGQLPDLNEAISLHRNALVLRPTPHTDRFFSLSNLATSLNTRFEQTGRLPDLEEAILMHREALNLRPRPHPDRSALLNNLATSLCARFELTDWLFDLDEAISFHREALTLRPASHPDRSSSLRNLATALHSRFRQTSQNADLDETIALLRDAVTQRPVPHPDRPSLLDTLGMTLHTRFDKTNQHSDLEEAVLLHHEALTLQPMSHPDRSSSLAKLANLLGSKHDRTRQLSDIEEGIVLCRQSLQMLPPAHPDTCSTLYVLGSLYTRRVHHTPDSRNVDEAVAMFHAAAGCETALVSERFAAARAWCRYSDLSDVNRESSLEAYETTIGLLPRLAMLGLDIGSRQRALASNTDGLARDAAACAIRSQKFEKAIEFLEAGRAIFWSQALHLRTPLDELDSVAPDLAQKLKNISCLLEQGALRDVSRTISDPHEKVLLAERETIRFRELNDQWLDTIGQIQKLDRFQDFLRPKSFASLSAAAANGPIVILNASQLRSDCIALIMRCDEDPFPVPLPQFTVEIAEELVQSLCDLLDMSIPATRGDRHLGDLEPPRDIWNSDSTFREVLATLWNYVVQPVLGVLKLKKSHSPPRLWWLPTGPFASLPIHAAGIYDAPGSECVSDYVVSSYTPTLSALLTPAPRITEPYKVLAVIQPVATGHVPLPYTREEMQKIENYVPKTSLIKLGIPGAPAYAENMLLELPMASIVHLACHGKQDFENPLESVLVLEDQLKVSQLMQLSMPNASLVFLSACETAMVNSGLPDEPIHLATTLLFAGFRAAVATLWSIEDRDGPVVAESFYRHLLTTGSETQNTSYSPDSRRAADALRLAVTELRDKLHATRSPSRYARWVPFVHFGA